VITSEAVPVDRRKFRILQGRFSRFRNQLIYQTADGKLFYGVYDRPSFPPTPQDTYHTVRQGEDTRLDLISYKYYQTPELWWVIAVSNDILDPLGDLAVGDVIRVPSRNLVFSQVFSV
jgi:hypothetical protein